MKAEYHIPVLLKETVDSLQITPSGIYVDCTFGGGGHSRAILEKLDAKGKLFVFDQDEDVIQNLPEDERIIYIQQNFRHLQRFLRLHHVREVNGILADLGVSSHQFDEAERGFSTRFDADLDMRMDKHQKLTAADILNHYPEDKLHWIFQEYGEVTNSRTLAACIVRQRLIAQLRTINAFKQSVYPVVKGNPHKYFAQVFQALRIAVNDELTALKEMLQQSLQLLAPGGRLAIITFHSLEDRLVKIFFRSGNFTEVEQDNIYGGMQKSPFIRITRKPILANADETNRNKRSRSAKLRVVEKVKDIQNDSSKTAPFNNG